MGKLTVAKLRAINKPDRYADGGTLFLYVAPGGSKSWVQRLTINGRRRDIGLGGLSLVSLADARDKAIDNRRIARSGGDPLAARRRAAVPTFREATAQTLEGLAPKWRNAKHRISWLQTVEKHAFPLLANLRVDQIERQDVLRALKPIWTDRPETGRRVRQRIRAVLSWCQAQGFVDINVAGEVIKGALNPMPSSLEHHRALPHAEMAHVLRTIEDGVGSPNAKLCLRFTVLTGARGSESRGALWPEIDFENRLWRLPPSRTKTRAPHDQPLSRAALAVLERARALDDGSGLVFPSAQRRREPLSDVAMMVVVKRNGFRDRMTVHGCRATFRTWASECTDADHAVKELSLGHLVGTKVERAYDRAELFAKRFALMEQWGSYVSPAPGESPDPGGDALVPVPAPAPVGGVRPAGVQSPASPSPEIPPRGAAPAPETVAHASKRSASAAKSSDRAKPLARTRRILQLRLFDD